MGAVKEYYKGGYNKYLEEESILNYQIEQWKKESTRKKAEKIRKHLNKKLLYFLAQYSMMSVLRNKKGEYYEKRFTKI